jgi:hypothetical protein
MLDEAGPEGISTVPAKEPRRDQVLCSHVDLQGLRRMGEGSSRVG